ncbi:class E sortase [Streptomyces sp. NPDC058877]|uniref:class E sortase n=1 Tax=Streptomyces sp. NPDC058877 TaxID=3346665 RepID=UPI00368F3022
MATTPPEDAAHQEAAAAWQPYPPVQWQESWYPHAPQAYDPASHLHERSAHPHPYAPPTSPPLRSSGPWHTSPPQVYAPIAAPCDLPSPPRAHPHPSPQSYPYGQPPSVPPPLQTPDARYPHPAQAYDPTPRSPGLSARPREDVPGALLQPESAPGAAAPAAPESGTGPSRRTGGRRAARRGAGSGRRRAPRRRTGARRRHEEPPSTALARSASTLLITSGLAMVLFVVHQVWWTNVRARAEAEEARTKLERAWRDGVPEHPAEDGAGAFAPGEGFAIIRIPALGLAFPVAEGTGTEQVLDKGLVGHYTGTGMPSDPVGNVVLAAHRNTHGEPFREIDRLVPGDRIVMETAAASYSYEVAGRIPETPPSDVSVLRPVPGGSPFTVPGRYVTLTTCTPEFSSRGRLIVFGRLVEERPRNRG